MLLVVRLEVVEVGTGPGEDDIHPDAHQLGQVRRQRELAAGRGGGHHEDATGAIEFALLATAASHRRPRPQAIARARGARLVTLLFGAKVGQLLHVDASVVDVHVLDLGKEDAA